MIRTIILFIIFFSLCSLLFITPKKEVIKKVIVIKENKSYDYTINVKGHEIFSDKKLSLEDLEKISRAVELEMIYKNQQLTNNARKDI